MLATYFLHSIFFTTIKAITLLLLIIIISSCGTSNRNPNEPNENSDSSRITLTESIPPPTTTSEQKNIFFKGSFIPPDSVNSWSDYINLSIPNQQHYKLDRWDKSRLNQIDLTDLGKSFYNEIPPLKSVYLISILDMHAQYFPCVMLIETYNVDQVENWIGVFMIDSTTKKIAEYLELSSKGQDWLMEWDIYGSINDSLITTTKDILYNCEESVEGIQTLKTRTSVAISNIGELLEVNVDTLKSTNCPTTE